MEREAVETYFFFFQIQKRIYYMSIYASISVYVDMRMLLSWMADDYVDDIVVSVWAVPHHCQRATEMQK